MRSSRQFAPGKIILSGEYSVLFDGAALAMPVGLGVTVDFTPSTDEPQWIWPQAESDHPGWKDYVDRIIDCIPSDRKLCGNLNIAHTLPLGKGMGSSTALIAAICRAMMKEPTEEDVRKVEDELSPGNSGIDFAVIWNNTSVLFSQSDGVRESHFNADAIEGALLIDTGHPDQPTPELVEYVRSHREELREPLNTIAGCTDRLLSGEEPKGVIKDHHRAQIRLGVVPTKAQKLIEHIEDLGGYAKVTGAGGRTGGGGTVLCFGLKKETLQSITQYPIFDLSSVR